MMRCLLLLAVAASTADATTLKFLFTKVRGINPNSNLEDISLSEIVVYDAGGTALEVASISGHHNADHPNNEGPASLIDGSNMTKWVDLNFVTNGRESYVIMELEESQPDPVSFEFYTNGQGQSRRDPESWSVWKENVCGGWEYIANWTDFAPPEPRGVAYNLGGTRFSLGSPLPADSVDATQCELTTALRFTFTKVRGDTVNATMVDGIQLGEIKLYGRTISTGGFANTEISLADALIDNPGGCGGTTEENQCDEGTQSVQLASALIDQARPDATRSSLPPPSPPPHTCR